MLSLYDVLEIVRDERKLSQFLRKYKIYCDKMSECPTCGSSLRADVHRGRPGLRCSSKACQKRVSSTSTGLLEGAKLSPGQWLMLAYFWAHDCAGERSVGMLWHSSATVADWSSRFRQCVLNQQEATVSVLGGKDCEVEAEEFQWRHNMASKDLFITLCEHIRDGYFQ